MDTFRFGRSKLGWFAADAFYRQISSMDKPMLEQLQQRLLEGRYDEVRSTAEGLLRTGSDSPGLRLLLGQASLAMGKPAEAGRHFERLLQRGGARPESWLGVAQSLLKWGQPRMAERCLAQAQQRFPDVVGVLALLAAALTAQGRLSEGLPLLEEAVSRMPGDPGLRNQLAMTWRAVGDAERALSVLIEAVQAVPGVPGLHNNLGSMYLDFWRLTEAREQFERALALAPDLVAARANLGNVLMRQAFSDRSLMPEAVTVFDQVIEQDESDCRSRLLRIQTARMICDWDGLEAQEKSLLDCVRQASPTRLAQIDPFPLLAIEGVTPADILHCGEAFAAQFPRGRFHEQSRRGAAKKRARIRLAYFSADFHAHPTTHLIREVIELHDRERFEVIGIDLGPDDGSEARAGILSLFDSVLRIPVTMAAPQAAREIARLEIDILVDLNGYTRLCRPDILALRPAPTQVQYLGYPAGMGADFIDYIIVDEVVLPPEQARYYREQVAYLPFSYQCNDRHRPQGVASTRAECGLPDNGFVYGCFNGAFKLTPSVFIRWLRILAAVEGSVLWLLDEGELMRNNLRAFAKRHGTDPDRLVFAPKKPHAEHMGRIGLADLMFDTSPYGAHTTASDALWSGVPVLTLMGETFAARVAASLLKAVGAEGLIALNAEDYERMAVDFGRGSEALKIMRASLVAARDTAPLFDTPALTRALEGLFGVMSSKHRAGEPPGLIHIADVSG